jgi:ribose transport system substrate-binding protein
MAGLVRSWAAAKAVTRIHRLRRARIAAAGVTIAAAAALIAGCSSSPSSSSPPAASSSAPAAASSAPAAASSSPAATGSVRMAIFYYNPSPYGVASLKSAQVAAAKLGIQLDAFDGNNNPQLQTTQIQDAITTGKYKAFWVWGLDDVALTPVINKAISAGIKVACADYTWGTLAQQNTLTASPNCATTIGQSVAPEAVNLENTMNAACTKTVGSGHCNIAFLPGLANYPTDTNRINAMTAYYKSKPNYTFTVMPPGQYDQTQSQSVAQTFFTAHKNINVFGTFGDQMAQGALTAMKLVGGYTPGQNIQIIGYGGAQEIINEVKSGLVYATLGLYPAGESQLGIQYLYDAVQGKSIPNLVNIIDPAARPAVIDKPFLDAHPSYVPDWTLEGGLGTAG